MKCLPWKHPNPGRLLTYLVDGLRVMMIRHGASPLGLGVDYGVMVGLLAGLVLVAARVYPGLAR